MSRLFLIAASALSLASLAACGGGGSAEVPPGFAPAAVSLSGPAPAAEVFGDSTLVGDNYPGQRVDPVAAAAAVLGAVLVNSAVKGSTVLSVSPERVAASRAPAVVMNWAINDAHDIPPEQYRARLTAQSVAAIAAGKAVVLLESTPVVPGGALSATRSEAGRVAFEAIKRDVASLTGAFYCALPARPWTLADKPDGLHESDDAARWKGEALAECIRHAL